MLISGTHETFRGRAIADWFGEQVGKPQLAPYFAMGWCDDASQLQAAFLFNDYMPGGNIEIHMMGDLRRPMIREGLRYAFDRLKVQRITAKPYRDNIEARESLLRLGFEKEAELWRYYGPELGDDAIVYRLRREAAERWMA